VDVNASCASLTATADYTGILNLGSGTYACNVFGDVLLDNPNFSMGNATLTVRGNFDNVHNTTFDPGTSHLVLTGVGKTFSSILDVPTTRRWYKLTFDTGSNYTLGGSNTVRVLNTLTVNGTVNTSTLTLDAYNTCNVVFGSAGSVSGAVFSLTDCQTGNGLITFPSTAHITTTNFNITMGWGGSLSFPPGTYEAANVSFTNGSAFVRTLILTAGLYKFTGHVGFTNSNAGGSLVIANTNNPNFEYQSNLTFVRSAGTLTYTKGTGGITLTGSNNQVITLIGLVVETITNSKSSGTVTYP
jgi:hypothetical protein